MERVRSEVAPRRKRLALAVLAFAAIAAAAIGAALAALKPPVRGGAAAPSPAAAPNPRAERRAAWHPAAAGSPLADLEDVAFAGGGYLSTDGRGASFAPAGLTARSLEVPVPIPRVFAGAARLFAQGESEGAPFLIALTDGEPIVVPMPCRLAALAGEGETLLGACAEGAAAAASGDGGKSFRRVALQAPAPSVAQGSVVLSSVEAVAVDADGAVAVIVTQRWEGDRLRWSWAQVGVRARDDRSFRFLPLPGLERVLAARLAGGVLTVAGAELSAEDSLGEGSSVPRLRILRGPAGQAPQPVGTPGPLCEAGAEAEGVLLDPQIGAFRCGAGVVLTIDGGARWRPQEGLGAVRALRGGEMRFAARAPTGTLLLEFPLRSRDGAVAQRLTEPGAHPRSAEIIAPADGIREPAPDASVAARP
jgi:hypothetical protein